MRMVLFLILLIMLLIIGSITVLAIGIGGAAFTIIFADVIVCIFIIIWIMKKLIHR